MPSRDPMRELILQKLDVRHYYEGIEGLELTDLGSEQFQTLCPFHDDHEPSMSIGPGGVFLCHACHAKGSVFDFWMRKHDGTYNAAKKAIAEAAGVDLGGEEENKAPIPVTDIDAWAKRLFKSPAQLKFLKTERGLNEETLKRFQIGWDGDRLTIPVREDGDYVNVRRYLPHAGPRQQKMIGFREGYNRARLFLLGMIADKDEVIICEGEWDALLLHQLGFDNTITVTSGAGTWRSEWSEFFKDKRVWLTFDNDDKGRTGMARVGRFLYGIAAEVRILQWPQGVPVKGDVTDWFIALKHDAASFRALLDAAVVYKPEEVSLLPTSLEWTDVGNAKRLVAKFGAVLRYCHMWRSWYGWDGQRWRRDDVQNIELLAKRVAEAIRKEVDPSALQPEEWQQIQKFSLKSEAQSRIRAMIDLAESEPEVAVTPDKFDTHTFLLPCLNGTVDLHTGELHESRKEDLITKLCPVDYDPEARSSMWERFLNDVTKGDNDLKGFLQMAVGYSITGDTREEKLFFVFGPTGAGKSTFLEAIKAALGEYSQTTNFSTFLETRMDGRGANPDIARMKGLRMIVSIEVEEGKKMAEGLVKQLTGGDKVTARHLYQEAFEFMPTAKLWLSANHKPRVSDEDDAIWRRILLVPFEYAVPKEKIDTRVKAELLDVSLSGAAILAWAVAGCLAWQKAEKLISVASVDRATLEYRAEQDPLIDWFEECVEPIEKAEIDNKILVQSYLGWNKDNGVRFGLTGKAVSYRLTKKGYPLVKQGRKVVRVGLTLKEGTRSYEEERF